MTRPARNLFSRAAACLAAVTLLLTVLPLTAGAAAEPAHKQSFEDFPERPPDPSQYSSALEVYTAQGDNDPKVRDGSKSMHYKNFGPPHNNTQALTFFKEADTVKLIVGERYSVSFWIRLVSIAENYKFWSGIQHISAATNPWSSTAAGPEISITRDFFEPGDNGWKSTVSGNYTEVTNKQENNWIQVTFDVTAKQPYLGLYFSGQWEGYIDDVVVTPYPSGVVGEKLEKPYCEDFFNQLDKTGIQEMVSKTGAGRRVLKLDLTTRSTYTFGVSMKKGAKGGTGKIWLSTDPQGDKVVTSEDGAMKAQYTSASADWERFSCSLMTRMPEDAGPVSTYYLVMENPTGEDTIRDVMLFQEKFAYKDNPNIEVVYKPVDYDRLPELANDYTPPTEGDVSDGGGDNVPTGLTLPVTLVLAAAVSAGCLLATMLLKKRRKDSHDA